MNSSYEYTHQIFFYLKIPLKSWKTINLAGKLTGSEAHKVTGHFSIFCLTLLLFMGFMKKIVYSTHLPVLPVIENRLRSSRIIGQEHDTSLIKLCSVLILFWFVRTNPYDEGCQLGSTPSSSGDEDKPFVDADWRSFRARLIAGEQSLRQEQDASSINDPDSVVNLPPTISIGNKWAHPIHEPEKGCLLIATEKLNGVHIFERTVVLLLSTGPVGPTGIILNRPSLMSIKEMRSTALDVAGTFSDRPLFFGGPLEEGLFLVSPNGGAGSDGVGNSGVFDEVMKGLYYGTKESVGCAAEMVKRNVVGVDNFRFFDGYCGWEKEQLKDEIGAGYWTVAACSPGVIGLSSVGSVGLWEEILGLMDPRKVL